jgi:hypothetical protein
MNIADVKSQLRFYKTNYPLKKEEIHKLEIMNLFIDFIEDDETEFDKKLDKLIKVIEKPKKSKIKKIVKVVKND